MSEDIPKDDVIEKQEGQENSDIKTETNNNEEVEEEEEDPVLNLSNHFINHFIKSCFENKLLY